MSSFYIVSPRKVAAGAVGQNLVTSLRVGSDVLINDITFSSANGTITITSGPSTIDLSVNTSLYLLKTGGVVTGDIKFLPTVGNVGLVLNAASADPSSTATGGLYFNTVSSTLKIFNGAAWVDVAQVGALTLTEANSLYLKLAGGTLTGNLALNNANLRLGRFTGADPVGQTGDIIFRDDLNVMKLYTSSGWTELSLGNLGVKGGGGIKVNGITGGSFVSTGQITLTVDLAANYTWTGNHTFNGTTGFGQAVTFASGQTFDIAKLTHASQADGAIIYYNGSTSTWSVLPAGTPEQILKVDPTTNRPTWGENLGGSIGAPTDTTYTDGYFDTWTSSTAVADAMDDINELLKLIAPQKPNLLTGTALVLTSSPNFYTVKLSSGLTNSWYQTSSGTYNAGDTITGRYFLTGALRLDTANNSSTFYAGKADTQSTYGVATHKIYKYNSTSASVTATTNATYDLTATGLPGTSGTLTIDSIDVYNTLWEKAYGHISYTQANEGWEGHSFNHTLSGETNVAGYWRDTTSNSSPTPSFSVSPSITELVPVDVWLSGIKYYGKDSTFTLSFKAASGIFDRCYHATSVAIAYGTGMNNLVLNPSTVPAYNAEFDKTGANTVTVTLDNPSQHTNTRSLSVALFKAHGQSIGSAGTASSSASITRSINTYTSAPATNTVEYFRDESYRLQTDTSSSFNSQTGMANGYLQVRNGTLTYPIAADYDSPSTLPYNTSPRLTFTGDQEYQRFFFNSFASSILLTISGLSNVASDISAVGTGSVNILAQIYDLNNPTTELYYDLGANFATVPIGSFRGGTNNLYGARVSASSSSLTFSFGVQNTQSSGVSPNYGKYRIIIIFRDNTKTITQITSAVGA